MKMVVHDAETTDQDSPESFVVKASRNQVNGAFA